MFQRSAAAVYLLLEGGLAFAFGVIFTLTTLYRIEIVGLDPLQLVLVGTMLEVGVLLLEIPTGVVADTISRRRSIILGVVAFGSAAIIEGAVPLVWLTFAAQFVWALGYTLVSGATEAWITDEVGETQAAVLFRRSAQVTLISGLAGLAVGTLGGIWSYQAPIVGGGVVLVLFAFWLARMMPEHGWQPTPRSERSAWHSMGNTLRNGWHQIRGSSLLIFLMIIAVLHGAWSESYDRLWQAHVLEWQFPTFVTLDPVVWFGLMAATATMISLGALELLNRWLRHRPQHAEIQAFFGTYLGLIVGMLGFALLDNLALGVFFWWSVTTFRHLNRPLMAAWLNRNIDSRSRATVLSFHGQADAVGQIAGGPLIGWIATVVSLPVGLLVGTALLVPILFVRPRRRKQSQPVSETNI